MKVLLRVIEESPAGTLFAREKLLEALRAEEAFWSSRDVEPVGHEAEAIAAEYVRRHYG